MENEDYLVEGDRREIALNMKDIIKISYSSAGVPGLGPRGLPLGAED